MNRDYVSENDEVKIRVHREQKLEYERQTQWVPVIVKHADKLICSLNPDFYLANPMLSLLLQSYIKLINSFCTIKI